jgi:hypothetical protein
MAVNVTPQVTAVHVTGAKYRVHIITGRAGPRGQAFANLDGGTPSTNYGGTPNIDAGGVIN